MMDEVGHHRHSQGKQAPTKLLRPLVHFLQSAAPSSAPKPASQQPATLLRGQQVDLDRWWDIAMGLIMS
jgi:hypothetical protein